MKYYSQKVLPKKIILVDGILRTGKLLTGTLISSFHNTEHLEFTETIEHFTHGIEYNKIEIDYAKSYISNYLNELIYNKYLSRRVNFRPTDRTGVPNSINFNTYKKRLKNNEGDSILKLIKKENKQLPLITHNMMLVINSLNKLEINYKMIEIFRNPINIVLSWFFRNYGNRFGKDQRVFAMLINKNNKIYPWFHGSLNNKFHNLNELEKCIDYVCSLTNRSIVNYRKLNQNQKKKIFITTYERIVEETEKEIKEISKFLNLKITKFTPKFIKKERCPKKFDKEKLDQNRLLIKSKVRKKYYDKIISLENSFNKNVYNLLRD
jgi:hypothetical protein